jgi:hypothetical protein
MIQVPLPSEVVIARGQPLSARTVMLARWPAGTGCSRTLVTRLFQLFAPWWTTETNSAARLAS